MHAIEVTATGGPEVLKYVDTPRPWPGTGEVLIKAEARFVLGAEIGDTVEARDDGVTALRVGNRVATADAGAAYAEYCIAAADVVALVPDAVTTDVAAAAILKGMEAQLSRQAGAVDVLDYPDNPQQFGTTIRQLTGGAGVAAVYDGVGESTFDASLASLAVRGTLVLFGATSGAVPPVDPQRLNAAGLVYLTRPSRLHFIRTRDAFTWRTNQLFDAIATGTVNVNVSVHYPLEDAAQAHRDLEGRETVGSVVLTP